MNRRSRSCSVSRALSRRLLPVPLATFAHLATCFLVGLAGPGCHREAASETPSQEAAATPLEVKVARVAYQSWPRVVRVQGSLVAEENVVVGAKVAGRVKQVPIDLGSVVRRGDLLAALDTEELELKVKQAEAQREQVRAKLGLKQGQKEDDLDRAGVPAVRQEKALWDQAQDNLRRAEKLREKQAIAIEEIQQRQAAVAVAEAKHLAALNDVEEQIAQVGVRREELALARQVLEDSKVPAPFNGVVEHRHVTAGAYVRVGDPIVSLVRVDPLRFRAGVPEREATRIRQKQPATITVEGEPAPIRVAVSRISPALDLASRSLTVEADVPNPGLRLRVGLFAEAEIVVDPDAQALAVPAAAVREFAGVEKVWLVRDGKAEEKIVQTGRRDAGRVEILQGLSPGDTIIPDAQTGRRGPVVAEGPSPSRAAEAKR